MLMKANYIVDDTKVICKRGATISRITQEVHKLNTNYNKITVVVGGGG